MLHTHVATALHEEHLATLRLIARLEALLGRPAPDIPDAPTSALLRDIQQAVVREIGPHFRFEEEFLFPRLQAAGEDEMAALLAEEHARILPLALHLAELAGQGSGQGLTPDRWRDFAAAGAAFAEALAAHVEKEEAGMLPALDDLLDVEADGLLSLAHAGLS